MEDLKEKIEGLGFKIEKIVKQGLEDAVIQAIVKYLKESGNKLIALMKGENPQESDTGSVEFGLTLYWEKNYDLLRPIWDLLGKPEPKITAEMFAQWKKILDGPGVLASNGTLIACSKYAQLDFGVITNTPGSDFIGWLETIVYYIYYLINPKKIHAFGKNGQVISFTGDQLTLALFGDWGTGIWKDGANANGPAMVLLDQALSLPYPPDLTLHLGDVYYAGTANGKIIDGRETINFLDLWKPGGPGTFALNSNHEMYPGAEGYFKNAMTASMFLL